MRRKGVVSKETGTRTPPSQKKKKEIERVLHALSTSGCHKLSVVFQKQRPHARTHARRQVLLFQMRRNSQAASSLYPPSPQPPASKKKLTAALASTGVAAGGADLLLAVHGAATAADAQNVRLDVARTKALGTLGLHVGFQKRSKVSIQTKGQRRARRARRAVCTPRALRKTTII